MDRVAAAAQREDSDLADPAREQLLAGLEQDPVFWSVQVNGLDRQDPNLFRRKTLKSYSCSGQSGNHHALMRCTWDSGDFFSTETLKFSRRGLTSDGQQYEVILEFDYDQFLTRHPEQVVYDPGADALQLQDQQIMGTWRLDRKSHIGDEGPRSESVSMIVGPRRTAGEYTVKAEVRMTSLDGSGKPAVCVKPQDRCKWSGTSTGILKIRGARVQIVYASKGWFTDRLQLDANELVGIDPWGDVFRFQRSD